MKLVDATFITESDRACQQMLTAHPDAAYALIRLINGYHEMVVLCLELMCLGETDTADMQKSLDKKEAAMHRLGIPIWESLEDWDTAAKEYYDRTR